MGLRASTLLPFLLLAAAPLGAQTFPRTLGGLLDDQPHCVESTTDGGYIIAGTESEMMII
jgi:hypothetical protein